MAELSAIRLVIETVGEKEAIAALDKLDATGRRVVDRVSQTTTAGLGNIAAAYQKAGAEGQIAFQRVAAQVDVANDRLRLQEKEARAAAASVEKAGAATEALGRRQGNATLAASRGLEQIARTGTIAGGALDTVLAQTSQLAFGFGTAGPIIGALAVATTAVVSIYRRAAEESKKLAESIAKDFERIANLDVAGQGRAAQQLYSGERFSADPMKRQGVSALEAQAAAARARIAAGSSTFTGAYGVQTKEMTDDAREAAEQLAKLNAELTRRRDLLASITGPGGSMQYAAGLEATARAAADATKEERNQLSLRRAQEDEALARGLAAYTKDVHDRQAEYRRASEAAVREFEADQDRETSIAIQQYNEQAREAQRAYKETADSAAAIVARSASNARGLGLAGLRKAINETVEEGGVYLGDAVAALSAQMQDALSTTLRDAVIAGFESAFAGGGVEGGLRALAATVLSGLGDLMERLGSQMLVVGFALEAFSEAMLSLNGPAAIAAGVALIAAGAGLKAIGRSAGANKSAGTSGASGGGYSAPPGFLSFGVGASAYTAPGSTVSAPNAVQPIQIGPIIGTADPKAQRDIATMVNFAMQRGLVRA